MHARAEHVICVFSTVNAECAEERKHVPSSDEHLHSKENFIGIFLDVASAKNDFNGVGNQFWWQRQSIDTPVTDKRPTTSRSICSVGQSTRGPYKATSFFPRVNTEG